MNRKQFLSNSLKAAAGVLVAGPVLSSAACNSPTPQNEAPPEEAGPGSPLVLEQVPLPYDHAALEPSIDARTMEIHYTKHHAGYVKKANAAIAEEGVKAATEAELIATIGAYSAGIRNNVGGVWNHNMFWQVMTPGATGSPTGKVLDALNSGFGSVEAFKTAFTEAAMERFGSGWAWLVLRNGKLEIGSTPNQDNPLMDVSDFKGTPLLSLDVWEHAYYLHYQNKRNEYVANWWNVVNWDEVARRLA